jgi:CheY-like chemotaxis protein
MSADRDILNGRRILIVEDEMVIAMLLEDMLEDIGCRVVATAAREAEALAALDAVEIDAAILDLNLNGARSYGIADALAARNIPFIFSTGYGAKVLEADYRQHPVLAKPFRVEELAGALAALLAGDASD